MSSEGMESQRAGGCVCWERGVSKEMLGVGSGYIMIQREKPRLVHSTDVHCTPNVCPELLGAGDVEEQQ